MALVVADTSPLRFLVEIGYEYALPQLFQQVWIPGAVARELRHERTPELVRQWAERLPGWVQARELGSSAFDRESAEIDQGEWEAIELAKEIRANLLLIEIDKALEQLGKTKFRRTPKLFAQTAQLARERRQRSHE